VSLPHRPREPSSRAVDERRRALELAGLLEDTVLDQELWRRAERSPDATYLVDRSGAHSYGSVAHRARCFAGALRELGVGRGDVVSFQLPNWVEAAVAFYATVLLGAVSNPIVPIYRERELGFILGQAKPTVAVVPGRFRGVDYVELYSRAAEFGGNHPVLIAVGEVSDREHGVLGFDECASHGPVWPVEGRHGADRAILLYTSGTTADPKGVLHSHASLRYECRSIVEHCGLVASDVVFMASPVTHITGLLYGVQLPTMIGASAVLDEIWDPVGACEQIERHGCTFTVGATPFLHGLTAACEAVGSRSVTSLRCFVCGGADIPPDLVIRARRNLGIPVVRAYGLSELPTATCGGLQDQEDRTARTDGRPLPGVRVRVCSDDGEARETGEGELEAMAPEMFLGYLDPALDGAAFTEDGWFRTGDVANIDEDGYVTIIGRTKDIIVRGGENISAREVEDVLFEHPKVQQVAVVGVSDQVMGQRACAFVVPGDEVPSLDELTEFLSARGVARQKAPERLEIVDGLPMTASGKVQKHRLRAWVEDVATS
jgi:cyclohexanecarboxylate-CoA ligase